MSELPESDLKEMIRREIWSMDENVGGFNIDEFEKLTSFAARKRYADENLRKIGAGSARIVYETNDGKVLKLAKNPKGIAQNEYECEMMNDYYIAPYITKIEDCHDENLWVLVEKAKKLTPTRFREITGVDIKDLDTFLTNMYSQNNGRGKIFKQENEDEMWDNEFSSGIADIMNNYGMPAGDLGKLSSYGEVIRDGQPEVVLVDYGLSSDVFSSHYERIRETYAGYFSGDFMSDLEADDVKDGGYAFAAPQPQTVGESLADELVSTQKIDKPVGTVYFANPGISETMEDYSDVSDKILKTAINAVERGFNTQSGKDVSKYYKLYLTLVQNFERALKLSNNDIEFFNNLMDIQGKLKKFGLLKEDLVYWHADDATKDEYTLGAETLTEDTIIGGLSKESADKIANHVSDKFLMNDPVFMAHGSFGFAYDTQNTVIKITTDKSEAVESLLIKGKNNDRIADIYRVLEVSLKKDGNTKDVFVVIQEKLDTTKKSEIATTHDRLDGILKDNFEGEGIATIIVDEYINDRFLWDKETKEDVDFVLKNHPKEMKHFYDLIDIADEVRKNNIDSYDFINSSNLGYKKNGKLGFFDIGFGDYFKKPKEKIEKLAMQEDGTTLYSGAEGSTDFNEKPLDMQEAIEDIPKILGDMKIDDFASKIANKLGHEVTDFLGSGTQGYAFELSNGEVMKITSDKTEALEAMKLVGKDNKHLGGFNKVYRLPNKNIYIILRESLDVDQNKYLKLIDDSFHEWDEHLKDDDKYYPPNTALGIYNDQSRFNQTKFKNTVDKIKEIGVEKFPASMQFIGVIEDMIKNNIRSTDVGGDNMGFKKDGTLAFYDLGYSDDGSADKIDVIDLGEDIKRNKTLNEPVELEDNKYIFSILEDSFIHFTTKSNVEKILLDNELNSIDGSSVFAVSEIYGEIIPEVQFNHLKKKYPNEIIVALRFKTSTVPKYGYVEEVVWDRTVTLTATELIGENNIGKLELKNSMLDENDQVFYIENPDLSQQIGMSRKDIEDKLFDNIEEQLVERLKSYMPNSKKVNIKKSCQLGGNGDGTSTACNQGDIDNIEMKDINDENSGKENKPNVAEEKEENRYYDPKKKAMLKEEKVKMGCLMLYFDIPDWNKILDKIDDDDLYDDGSGTFGKEEEPHITVLYGFHDNEVKAKDFYEIIEEHGTHFKLKATAISLFENEKFDVVKFDIEPTEELLALRKDVEELPNTLTYKDYHPHMTIAYVKSGKGGKYVKDFGKKYLTLETDKLVYSDANKEKTEFLS
jgi:2'-5' RNA ligase